MSATAATETTKRVNKRRLQGIVFSDKMDKTITIKVLRRYKHTLYKKYVSVTKKYMAHDEKNTAHAGDKVEIVEDRPRSKNKTWRFTKVLAKAKI